MGVTPRKTTSVAMAESGYAVFSSDNLLEAVTAARASISELIGGLFNLSGPLPHSFRKVFEADINDYLTLVRVLSRLRAVRRLIQSDGLTDFLRAELGYKCPMEPSEPVIHIQGDELRIPNGYFGYGGHQDMTAFGGCVPKLTTVWIPLFDVTLDTFPLEIAVGRHRSGIFDTVPANQVYEIPASALEDAAYIPVTVKAGSALLFDGFTPHRSGRGKAGTFRLAFSYRIIEACDAGLFARHYQYADPSIKKT